MADLASVVSGDAEDGSLVLPVEAQRPLELMDACVAWVVRQAVSTLIQALDAQRQPELSHLRRVYRDLSSPPPPPGSKHVAVLLCAGMPDHAAEILPPGARAVLEKSNVQLLPVRVPRHAPIMRWQFEEWGRVWPLNFHEAAAAHRLAIYLQRPTVQEAAAMRQHMRRAISLAERAMESGGRPVAALVVRRSTPSSTSTVAQDGSGGNEDIIAASSDGTISQALHGQSAAGNLLVDDGGGCGLTPHPLGHAVMRCIEQVAALERRSRDSGGGGGGSLTRRKRMATADGACEASIQPGGAADGGEAGCGANVPSAAGDGSSGEAGSDAAESSAVAPAHLCTDCDIYVTHEPCAMCAMALVHSRVHRLIYALPAEAGGALGSRYKLNAERALNHHFQVIRGLGQAEAMAAGLAANDALSAGS